MMALPVRKTFKFPLKRADTVLCATRGSIRCRATNSPSPGDVTSAVDSPPQDSSAVTASPARTALSYRRRRSSMQDALDHTKINASLYLSPRPLVKQLSIATSKKGAKTQPEEAHRLGLVNFSLRYDQDEALLTVRLVQARDLVARDNSRDSVGLNPYCRLSLLPNRQRQIQSRVQRRTACPEFEEEFLFDIPPPGTLPERTLEILVYDYDQFSLDECLGQVLLSLADVDFSEGSPVDLWRGLSPYQGDKADESAMSVGVLFSLAYLPSAGRLTVAVMKARNLQTLDRSKHTVSAFVKVSIIIGGSGSGGKKLKKKKTSTKWSTLQPVWNEALVFNAPKESLQETSIELRMFNNSLLGNNDLIGRVVLGPNTAGVELAHWNDMVNSKTAMARWHNLVADSHK